MICAIGPGSPDWRVRICSRPVKLAIGGGRVCPGLFAQDGRNDAVHRRARAPRLTAGKLHQTSPQPNTPFVVFDAHQQRRPVMHRAEGRCAPARPGARGKITCAHRLCAAGRLRRHGSRHSQRCGGRCGIRRRSALDRRDAGRSPSRVKIFVFEAEDVLHCRLIRISGRARRARAAARASDREW